MTEFELEVKRTLHQLETATEKLSRLGFTAIAEKVFAAIEQEKERNPWAFE